MTRGSEDSTAKHLLLSMASAMALTAAAPAAAIAQTAAAQAETKAVDIPAGPLGETIAALILEYDVNIIVREAMVEGKRAPAVAGDLSAEEAVAQAFSQSGLTLSQTDSGAYVAEAVGSSERRGRRNVDDEIVIEGVKREYLYRTEDTDALGANFELAKLPAVVNTVTSDFLEDTAAYDIEDILTYVPGVVTGGFTGGTSTQVVIRGFRNDSTFFNGLRQFRLFQQPPSLENLERVEFVKGPAGAEFALADPGGTLNFVTKKPEAEFAGEVFGGIGTFGYRRVGGDFTGPVTDDGSVRYRLIASYSERAEWRDGRPPRTPRATIAPSVAWDYADTGSVLLEYQYTFSDEPLDRGIFYLEGAGFENNDNFAPREFSFQNVNDQQEAETNRFDLTLTQDFGEIFGIDIRAQRLRETTVNFQTQAFGNFQGPDGLTWDGTTTTVRIFPRDDLNDTTANNIQAVLRADFATGEFVHRARVGYQYYDASFDVDFGTDGIPGRRQISNVIDIFNPDNAQILDVTGRDNATRFQDNQEVSSVFGQWTTEWQERARILFGVRYDDSENFTRFDQTTGLGSPSTEESQDVSFRVAGSFDLTNAITAFAGYSDSALPQGGFERNGTPIDPLENVSYEVGVKTQLFDGNVLWTNTIYQITQDGIAAADLEDPLGLASIPFGEVRIRGFESEFVGTVGEDLDLSVGVTYQDSENIRTENPEFQGNEFFSVPNIQASAFLNYRFDTLGFKGFSTRLGVVHVGEREGNALNNFQLPAYTRIDLGGRYVWDDQLSFDLFVENLFDEFYIEQAQGRVQPSNGIIPGDRRLIQFNARYAF